MKVFCIDNRNDGDWITQGKWYDVLPFGTQTYNIYNIDKKFYRLINDRGFESIYLKKLFKTQREVREEKLSQLGI